MTQPLLTVDDLHARVGSTEVLSGVSLRLDPGGALGVVGETGAGKSMTVRAITGLLRRIGGRVTEGSVVLGGQDLTNATDRTWRRWQGSTVALVPQASMSSLDPLQRIGRQFHSTIRGADRSADVAAETARLLESVRLEPNEVLLRAYPHELSGGMRQRVMIGLALATRPALLVADEPTTALDASIRGEILALLMRLREERGLALLLVSHDLSAIEAATDTTVVMYAGRSVESGPTTELVAAPAHPYTRALLDARPERTPPGQPLPAIPGRPATPGEIRLGCPFAPRCPAAMAECVVTTPGVVQISPRREVACLLAEPQPVVSSSRELAVEIVARKLDFSYGAKQVLWDVSVVAVSGNRLGVIGESGSGKTTLARLLAGALASPLVTVDSKPWAQQKRSGEVRRRVQMIHQDPFASLSQHMSALSAVREAVQVCRKLPRRQASVVATELLESVGVGAQLSSRRPEALSGGQCQRVAIARALAADPAIIVADEPTSALDLSVQAQIINVLLQVMAERSTGMVLVSHDLAVIRHLTDEVVVMQHGRVVESGATAEVLSRPRHPYTRKLCSAAQPTGHVG